MNDRERRNLVVQDIKTVKSVFFTSRDLAGDREPEIRGIPRFLTEKTVVEGRRGRGLS